MLALAMMAAPMLAGQADCPEPRGWQPNHLDTSFERERRLAGLATPMRSSGRVQSDGDALLWRTEAPIEMVMRIDDQGVFQSVGGGPMQPLVGTAQGGAEVASLIGALLRGDLERAAEQFSIQQHQDPASGSWHVVLEPKAEALGRAIERLEIAGCDRVEEVVIDQPNGDQDRVVFGDVD